MEHYLIATETPNTYKEVFTMEYRNDYNDHNLNLVGYNRPGTLIEFIYNGRGGHKGWGLDSEHYIVIDSLEELKDLQTKAKEELISILKRNRKIKQENHRKKVSRHILSINGEVVFDSKTFQKIWAWSDESIDWHAGLATDIEPMENGRIFEVKTVTKYGWEPSTQEWEPYTEQYVCNVATNRWELEQEKQRLYAEMRPIWHDMNKSDEWMALSKEVDKVNKQIKATLVV